MSNCKPNSKSVQQLNKHHLKAASVIILSDSNFSIDFIQVSQFLARKLVEKSRMCLTVSKIPNQYNNF